MENGVSFAHHAQCEAGGASKLFTAHCYAMCKQRQQRGNSATERPLLDAENFLSYLSRSDKEFPHPYVRDRHIVTDDYKVK